jgi:hypothetical protein
MVSADVLSGPDVARWTVVAIVVIGVNLVAAHKLAARFEAYLRGDAAGQNGLRTQVMFIGLYVGGGNQKQRIF